MELLNKVVKVRAKVLVKHDFMQDYIYFDFDFPDVYPSLQREDWFRKDMAQATQFVPSIESIKIETKYVELKDSELLDRNFHPADHFTIN